MADPENPLPPQPSGQEDLPDQKQTEPTFTPRTSPFAAVAGFFTRSTTTASSSAPAVAPSATSAAHSWATAVSGASSLSFHSAVGSRSSCGTQISSRRLSSTDLPPHVVGRQGRLRLGASTSDPAPPPPPYPTSGSGRVDELAAAAAAVVSSAPRTRSHRLSQEVVSQAGWVAGSSGVSRSGTYKSRATVFGMPPPGSSIGVASRPKKKKGSGRAGWLLTASVALKASLGIGILSLPGDFARLGWIPSAVCLLLLALGVIYSSSLYTRLLTARPDLKMYHSLGYQAYGKHGRMAVYLTVYLTIFLMPCIFHLTAVEALRQMLPGHDPPQLLLGLAVFLLIVPLAQVRNLSSVGWWSVLGTLGMLLAIIVASCKLLLQPPPKDLEPGETHLVERIGFFPAVVGVMNFVFAFSGQENWVRLLAGMRKRAEFTSSITLTVSILTPLLAWMGALGYSRFGNSLDTSRPITSVLREDAWSVVMNTGVFISTLISYHVAMNIWVRMVIGLFAPEQLDRLSEKEDGGLAGATGDEEQGVRLGTVASMDEPPRSHPSQPTTAWAARGASYRVGAAVAGGGSSGGPGRSSSSGVDGGGSSGSAVRLAGAAAGTPIPVAQQGSSGESEVEEVEDELSEELEEGGEKLANEASEADDVADSVSAPLLVNGRLIRPSNKPRLPRPHDPGMDKLLWLIITVMGASEGYVTGYIFPYFGEVMAVVASFGTLSAMFLLPCLFSIRLLRLSRYERVLCWALVAFAGLLSCLGVVCSLQQLVVKLRMPEANRAL